MTSDTIRIACAADRAFLRHVPVMLASLRATTDAPLHVSVVGTDWRARDVERLRKVAEGIELDVLTLPAGLVAGLEFKTVLSPLSYARCVMADLIYADRFLYFDVDMIVRSDVRELWALDIGDAPAAAVFHGDGRKLNAGLLLVNARVWRERRLGQVLLEWARLHRPKEADQGAIEALIGSEMLRLDPRWNRLVDPIWGSKDALRDSAYLDGAKLLHFITGFKPWNLGALLLPRRYVREWRRHVRRTGLPTAWRQEARTAAWQSAILLRRALRR